MIHHGSLTSVLSVDCMNLHLHFQTSLNFGFRHTHSHKAGSILGLGCLACHFLLGCDTSLLLYQISLCHLLPLAWLKHFNVLLQYITPGHSGLDVALLLWYAGICQSAQEVLRDVAWVSVCLPAVIYCEGKWAQILVEGCSCHAAAQVPNFQSSKSDPGR